MDAVLRAQKNEITEYHIYATLALKVTNKKNKKVLQEIAKDELGHYNYWKKITKVDVKPKWFIVYFYVYVSYFLGLTFGLKLMERGEKCAQEAYDVLGKKYPKGRKMMDDEHRHEKKLLNMFEEEKLHYASSIVLGLNDALVELTGALAGFTFALQNGRLIGIIGLITGVAAAMSMAASGYLSSREDGHEKAPIKSAIYTGVAYIITVLFLVTPFFLMSNVFVALGVTLLVALTIICTYTFYIAIAKDYHFSARFIEMAIISLGVALISFAFGWIIKSQFGVDA